MVRMKTRAERNIAWIERYCRVPEGKHVGKPIKLLDWQKNDICRIYDIPLVPAAPFSVSAAKTAKRRSPRCFCCCCTSAGRRRGPIRSFTAPRKAGIKRRSCSRWLRRWSALGRSVSCRNGPRYGQTAGMRGTRHHLPGALGRGVDGIRPKSGVHRS